MKMIIGFIAVGFILMFCSCVVPEGGRYYYDLRLPRYTPPKDSSWSLEKEMWFMGDNDTPEPYGKRDTSIINKYYINGVLCYAKLSRYLEDFQMNPYYLGLMFCVKKELDTSTSVTIKNIKIYQQGGNDISYLINNTLPITILFGKGFYPHKNYFQTKKILKFKRKKTVFIEVTMDVQSTENTETGTLFFELTPKVEIRWDWWIIPR